MPKRLERSLPKVGAQYLKEYKGKVFVLEVVEKNGRIGYYLDGKLYRTPTAAAKSITQSEVNGWDFWKIN